MHALYENIGGLQFVSNLNYKYREKKPWRHSVKRFKHMALVHCVSDSIVNINAVQNLCKHICIPARQARVNKSFINPRFPIII